MGRGILMMSFGRLNQGARRKNLSCALYCRARVVVVVVVAACESLPDLMGGKKQGIIYVSVCVMKIDSVIVIDFIGWSK